MKKFLILLTATIITMAVSGCSISTPQAEEKQIPTDEKIILLQIESYGSYENFFVEELVPKIKLEANNAGYNDYSSLYKEVKNNSEFASYSIDISDNIDYAKTCSIGRMLKKEFDSDDVKKFFEKYEENILNTAKEAYLEGIEKAKKDVLSEYDALILRIDATDEPTSFFKSLIPEIKAKSYSEGYSYGIKKFNFEKEHPNHDYERPVETLFTKWAYNSEHPFFQEYCIEIIEISTEAFEQGQSDAGNIAKWQNFSIQEKGKYVSDLLFSDKEIEKKLNDLGNYDDFLLDVVNKIIADRYTVVTKTECKKIFEKEYKAYKQSKKN